MEALMWVEKYRPKTLNELVNQDEVKERLKWMLKNPKEIPHMLFAGPPGTGKTTAALCIARQVLGEAWRDLTLELNASDERGIKTIRERVKVFASYVDTRAPFRIIILDEADEMTSDAQTALRRIMEESSRICRFILICNYSSGIIEPIQSRTAIFRFVRLPEKEVINHLKRILENEGKEIGKRIKYDEEALNLIYELSQGDLRHAINLLQAAASSAKITVEEIRRIAGIGARGRVEEVINLAIEGEFQKAREKLLELIGVYGMPERDFLKFATEILFKKNLVNAGELAELLAEYDYRLIMGANPEIQLTALLAELSRFGGKGKR
jgi:replication factor C small subunit